jgi:hypothetical protein
MRRLPRNALEKDGSVVQPGEVPVAARSGGDDDRGRRPARPAVVRGHPITARPSERTRKPAAPVAVAPVRRREPAAGVGPRPDLLDVRFAPK